MDFEARIPEDMDFHGMRTLLQQVCRKHKKKSHCDTGIINISTLTTLPFDLIM